MFKAAALENQTSELQSPRDLLAMWLWADHLNSLLWFTCDLSVSLEGLCVGGAVPTLVTPRSSETFKRWSPGGDH